MQTRFAGRLRHNANLRIPYVWGGRGPDVLVYDTKAKQWAKGVDCFFYILMSAREARIPGVSIVRARDMALGRGGWHGIDLAHGLRDANEECDLIYWTWRGQREIGHVGAVLLGPSISRSEDRILGVVDAGSKGTGWRPLFNADQVTKVRRLTIGDKK